MVLDAARFHGDSTLANIVQLALVVFIRLLELPLQLGAQHALCSSCSSPSNDSSRDDRDKQEDQGRDWVNEEEQREWYQHHAEHRPHSSAKQCAYDLAYEEVISAAEGRDFCAIVSDLSCGRPSAGRFVRIAHSGARGGSSFCRSLTSARAKGIAITTAKIWVTWTLR